MSSNVTTAANKPADQWLRKASLVVASGGQGIDLSQLRFRFSITTSDQTTFNNARIRVYNLKDSTLGAILGNTGVEYTRVVLQAGYEYGAFGIIFDGTIKQFGHGKESNVDSYLDIFAADGDLLNYAVVNQSLAGPVTQAQQFTAIGKATTPYGVVMSPGATGQVGGVLPRGKVLFGLALSKLRDLGKSRLTTWSIQNGVATEVPLTGYLPDDVVKINSQTGLIGAPETTQNGLTLTCLLNPKIKIGRRVQLNNKEVNQTIIKNRSVEPSPDSLAQYASEAADGVYRVCVHEYEGDTRGNAWYSHLTVLSIDPSATPASSVLFV